MTPDQFKQVRKRLGLSQSEMARKLRLKGGSRVVRFYELGEREISGPITLCLDYMLKYGALVEKCKKQP